MAKAHKFEELDPETLKKVMDKHPILYLPLGTLEWHQQHLPFGLDATVSYYLCQQACIKTGGAIIPPLYFGTDREHDINGKTFHGMDATVAKILPGNLYYLNEDLFFSLIRSIAINTAEQGFKTLVIVSAHSGTAQQRTIERLSKEGIKNLSILVFPGKKFIGSIDHAGKTETSMMLAIDDTKVNLPKLKKPYEALIGKDPLKATKEEGKERLTKIVDQIVQDVNQEIN